MPEWQYFLHTQHSINNCNSISKRHLGADQDENYTDRKPEQCYKD